MKKILVTGSEGFIASYVIQELHRQGYQAIGLQRHAGISDAPLDAQPDIIYYADIRDDAGVYGAIEHADGVIHLAGLLGTSENIRQAKIMNDVNINGALNVLNAVDNFKIPSVIIAVGNHFENNTYSISKTTAERYALMYAHNFGTKVNVVRALNAIGPRQKWGKINKILPTFINKALRGEDIPVYGGKDQCGIMDLVYVGDVAKVLIGALHMAVAEKSGYLFEAGTGVGYPVYEIAEKVIAAANSSSKITEVPMRAGESNRSIVVAQKPYPIEYRGIDEVLAETVAYYQTQL